MYSTSHSFLPHFLWQKARTFFWVTHSPLFHHPGHGSICFYLLSFRSYSPCKQRRLTSETFTVLCTVTTLSCLPVFFPSWINPRDIFTILTRSVSWSDYSLWWLTLIQTGSWLCVCVCVCSTCTTTWNLLTACMHVCVCVNVCVCVCGGGRRSQGHSGVFHSCSVTNTLCFT